MERDFCNANTKDLERFQGTAESEGETSMGTPPQKVSTTNTFGSLHSSAASHRMATKIQAKFRQSKIDYWRVTRFQAIVESIKTRNQHALEKSTKVRTPPRSSMKREPSAYTWQKTIETSIKQRLEMDHDSASDASSGDDWEARVDKATGKVQYFSRKIGTVGFPPAVKCSSHQRVGKSFGRKYLTLHMKNYWYV